MDSSDALPPTEPVAELRAPPSELLDAPLAPGRMLGCYRIVAHLGRGGMGDVYRARDEALDREVALKTILKWHAANPEFVRRFQVEARAAARIEHPNLVRVHWSGEEGGVLFFAMEFVRGRNLGDLLRERGPLPWAEALGYAVQAARGLGAAAAAGVLHRDVKPENLLLSDDGVVKVGDFGLAKVGGDGTNTASGVIAGTARYMSPEQAQGDALDARSDIYSLGATLFHFLAGRPVFEGSTPMKICLRHIQESPPELASLLPGCPLELSRVVSRTLAKRREDRFASWDEVIGTFELLLTSARGEATTRLPGPQAEVFPAAGAGARLAAQGVDLVHTIVIFVAFEFLLFPFSPLLHAVLHLVLGSAAALAHILYLGRRGGTFGERLLGMRSEPSTASGIAFAWFTGQWSLVALSVLAPPLAKTWGVLPETEGLERRLWAACAALGTVTLADYALLVGTGSTLRDRIVGVTVTRRPRRP